MAKKKKGREKREKGGDEQGRKKGVKRLLADIDDWDDTEEMSFEDLPDGKYQVRIEAAVLNESKASGRLQVSLELEVLGGKFKGRKIYSHQGIDTPENRGYFRTYLARLGIKWPAAEDFEGALEELIGKLCRVSLRTRGEFQNTRIEAEIDKDDVEEEPDDDTDDDDDNDDKDDDDKDDDDDDDDNDDDNKKGKKKKKDKEDDEDDDDDDDDNKKGKKKKGKKKKEDKEDDKDDNDKDEQECTASFDDTDLSKTQRKEIKVLAKKADFNVKDYETRTDLLLDLAETCKVFGAFKKPDKLIRKVSEALEED